LTLLDTTVQSGSARIGCTVGGEGTTIAFLHAGVADRRSFGSALATFSRHHRAVAPDRRGHGTTTWDPEPHDPVADLIAVLDAIGARRAVLVGNSLGGALAIDTALARPERVAGLVLIGTAVSGAPESTPPPEIQALWHAIEAAEAAGDLDEVNRIEARIWLDGWPGPEGRVGGALRALFLDMNLRALRAGPIGDRVETPPAWPRLGEIGVPVTAVVGSLDLPHVVERTEALVKRIPEALGFALDGTAHLPSLEAPDRLNDVIFGLLRRAGSFG
jgi:pimeloyl-ACP methyl ester carboxylesterase